MNREGLLASSFPGSILTQEDETLTVTRGEDILSFIGIFWRTIVFDGVRVEVCGIGSVCTAAAFRGKGLASMLIELAHLTSLDRGVKVAALWSDYEDFYDRLGYIPTSLPTLLVAPLVGTAYGGPTLLGSIEDSGERW